MRSTTLTNRTLSSAQQLNGGQRLLRRHVAGRGDDEVRLLSRWHVRGPVPDAGAGGAELVGLLHREVLKVRLLVEDDEVDVILAAQAVVQDGQPRVGVWREPDANHPRGEREQRVDESRPLVGEPVVVVPPAGARQENVERRDRFAPGQLLGVLEPLDVLDGHRRGHHGERLVGREHAVPAAEEIPLQPPGAQVLGEDLHDPAVRGDLLVGRLDRCLEAPVGRLEHRLQPVARRLVRTEQPERAAAVVGDVRRIHVPHQVAHRAGALVDGDPALDGQRVAAQLLDGEVLQEPSAVSKRGGRHSLVAVGGERAQFVDKTAAFVE
jgi:hypothetical protein